MKGVALKAMVVDDEEKVRKTYNRLLSQEGFEVGEVSVAGIRCGRDAKLGMILESEQMGEVGVETADGTTESLVNVLSLVVLFEEKGSVGCLEFLEASQEGRLVQSGEPEGESSQSLPAFRLWLQRGVPSDDLLLVEETELNGDERIALFEKREHSSSPVNREALVLIS